MLVPLNPMFIFHIYHLLYPFLLVFSLPYHETQGKSTTLFAFFGNFFTGNLATLSPIK